MDFAADFDVLFDEFAREFTHSQSGVVFKAIFGVVDQEALQGYSITAEHEIHYPTASVSLSDGDEIEDSGGSGFPAGTLWKVRAEPVRVNDGLESMVFLSRKAT